MLETIKKQTQALEERNLELEEFSYRTSHDLRSPVVSTIGLLSVVKKNVNSQNTQQALKAVDLAENSLRKLIKLIEDILILTKSAKNKVKKEKVDVEQIINDSIELHNNMQNAERIEYIKNFEYKDNLYVYKNNLQLIVDNLISNAIKYQDNQKLSSFIKITTKTQKDSFILTIQDNGVGIAENNQGDLFLMFKRFHPKVSFGSGLGLYMVKKNATLLEGQIEYIDDLSNNTTFKLTLPTS